MKNRRQQRMVVLLAVVVMIVWGLIIRQLLEYTGMTEERNSLVGKCPGIIGQVADSLLLNYRDPFTDTEKKVSAEPERVCVRRSNKVFPASSPPSFRFSGKIRKGVKDFLLMEKADSSLLVREKGLVDGFRIFRVAGDSVVVSKAGKYYTLFLE